MRIKNRKRSGPTQIKSEVKRAKRDENVPSDTETGEEEEEQESNKVKDARVQPGLAEQKTDHSPEAGAEADVAVAPGPLAKESQALDPGAGLKSSDTVVHNPTIKTSQDLSLERRSNLDSDDEATIAENLAKNPICCCGTMLTSSNGHC